MLAAFMLAGILLLQAAQAQLIPRNGVAPRAEKRQIVAGDPEELKTLSQLLSAASEKNDRADEALQALQKAIDQINGGFVAIEDGLYIGMGIKAQQLLAGLKPELRARYRQLQNDSAALRFQWTGPDREEALGELVHRYLNTIHGPEAMDALAMSCFDRGHFVQACMYWRDLLDLSEPSQRPMLLSKLAIAHHLAGQKDRAARCLEELVTRHPRVRGVVSGQEQDLAQFVRSGLTTSAPADTATGGQRREDLSGPTAQPLWLRGANEEWKGQAKLRLDKDLIALEEAFRGPLAWRFSAALEQGHVRMSWINRPPLAPATVQPLVTSGMVIYRTSRDVVARNLDTGKLAWKLDGPPVQRPWVGTKMQDTVTQVEDVGRYAPTLGNGGLFIIGSFRPWMHDYTVKVLSEELKQDMGLRDDSTLTAVSMNGQILWQVGCGRGSDKLLQEGKFLSAPAVSRGRLYVVMQLGGAYVLACLDAAGGGLFWSAKLSETSSYNLTFCVIPMYPHGTPPPVVADGKVFVSSNDSVVGAFDVRTGQPLWARQYDAIPLPLVPVMNTMTAVATYPVNPVLVAGGRLICLPGDSSNVLCLSAHDGRLLWSAPRGELRDLSYIDEHRILLSGPGIKVLQAEDGKVLFEKGSCDVHGRPAIGEASAFASAKGKLLRLDLVKYEMESIDLGNSPFVLGNLVAIDGRVVAANPAGVCVFGNKKMAGN